jgi:epoxyqueuosine reductase
MSTFTEIAEHDGKILRVVPVERLEDLRRDIEQLRRDTGLNKFQNMITGTYTFNVPELPFTVRSIIVAAIPHFSYADAVFHLNGKEYKVYSAFVKMYDTSDMDIYIDSVLAELGRHSVVVPMMPGFPQRLLGAKCGLAVYGRNNITYIDGLGSYFGYATYYSDVLPDCEVWHDTTPVAKTCETCGACIKNCKTGAITRDRFLIDTDKCYSGMSTRPGDFPPVPNCAHHSIVRCMKCQYGCPMNAQANLRTYPAVSFDEAETAHILSGVGYDNVSVSLRERAVIFGFDKFNAVVPRNLKICFDLIDSGETFTLR